MNLTEKMALDCGVKISKPHLDTFYMPLKNYDYIVIDSRSRFQFGDYDYFNEAISLVKKYLYDRNIEIFQLASEKCPRIECTKCFVKINKKQENFLIKNAKLVVANENSSIYAAAVFNVKCIGLYAVTSSEVSRPVWNKDSQIVIESHRHGNKPTYGSLTEKPKTINLISPYVIAKNILDALNIENDLHKYELIHIGESYNQKIMEIVPDFYSETNFLAGQQINLRLDYVSSISLDIFNYWLTNRKVNLITDKDINISVLAQHKNSIALITAITSQNLSEEFLLACKALGFKIKIFCNSPEHFNDYKFKFLNWEVAKDFDENKKISNIKNISKDSKFKSSKTILSKGKKFSCKANFFANKALDNIDETVTMSPLFEEELEFFKIYNEKQ